MKIKVISLNIWCGGELFDEIVAFLKEQDADIVALQEVYNGNDSQLANKYQSMRRLQERLQYPHAAFVEAYRETIPKGKVPHGNAVFSKFPIINSSMIYLAEPMEEDFEYQDISEHWPLLPAPLQQVTLDTSNGQLNIFNIHGVWDLDGDNYSERRQRMSEVILAQIKGIPNVIVMGDTNAKASNPAMRNLEAYLKPVFGEELGTTFNLRHKTNPGYATAAVDLMYVSPEITVVSKAAPPVDISDHLPLVVELDIPKPN